MIRRWWVLLICLTVSGLAGAVELKGLRGQTNGDGVRVVFDLSAPVKYRIFPLTGPNRLVVDMDSTSSAQPLKLPATGMVKSVRAGKREGGGLRVVLDLSAPVKPKSFLLGPQGSVGNRLVVDLADKAGPATVSAAPARAVEPAALRPVVIVIDPGHGGIDPGAHGKNGVREKDVVLGISRELARLINQQAGMKAILTRNDDRFIELSERRRIASKHRADLFLSIHANSFTSSKVKGSAVYALSEKGASSAAAKALADKENAADLLGGVDLSGKNDLIKSVLMDLSQNATQESSLQLAEKILHGLGGVNSIHKRHVQTAGFVVLKSPSVPSVLVETAFISNPNEEKVLGSSWGQRKFAKAIFAGVQDFVQRDMSLRLASVKVNAKASPRGEESKPRQTTYEVRPGDTLSRVAQRYRVSLSSLRSVNSIRGDRLLVGEKLRIPL